MHGKGMCPMHRPTSRVHVHHQNDQDRGKFHIARLHCIFALRCALCCPGTSESVSLRLAPECSALPSRKWSTKFRASSVRDFDEDAQEALRKRTTSTTTSHQRRIYTSAIAPVSLCLPRYRSIICSCNASLYGLTNGSIARSQPTLTWAHADRTSCSTGIAIFSTGPPSVERHWP